MKYLVKLPTETPILFNSSLKAADYIEKSNAPNALIDPFQYLQFVEDDYEITPKDKHKVFIVTCDTRPSRTFYTLTEAESYGKQMASAGPLKWHIQESDGNGDCEAEKKYIVSVSGVTDFEFDNKKDAEAYVEKMEKDGITGCRIKEPEVADSKTDKMTKIKNKVNALKEKIENRKTGDVQDIIFVIRVHDSISRDNWRKYFNDDKQKETMLRLNEIYKKYVVTEPTTIGDAEELQKYMNENWQEPTQATPAIIELNRYLNDITKGTQSSRFKIVSATIQNLNNEAKDGEDIYLIKNNFLTGNNEVILDGKKHTDK